VTIAHPGPAADPATSDDRNLPPSALVLVAANLVPLAGVLAFGWSVYPVLLVYWCENVAVGAFNVLRIAFAQPQNLAANLGKLFLIPFFIVHYGMFTMVHGIFVVALFGPKGAGAPGPSGLGLAVRQAHIGWAVLAIALSHGYSFLHNYLFSGEYRQASPQLLMMQPYARVMVLHATILLGGFAFMALHAPAAALVVLVGLKTAIDLRSHLSERRKLGAPAAA
jgi:hypothetical protein